MLKLPAYTRKFLFLLFLFPVTVFAQKHTISGYITDVTTGETLINASVFEKNSSLGKLSNVYGFYSLTVPEGDVNLQYSYVGYTPENRVFKLTKDTIINIRLESRTTLQEVTVVGRQNELGVKGSQMSTIEVPIAQIKSIPALFGETDIIKALQLLPGVQAGTEGSAGLYVRGGGPDENLLLLDGVPVYNVNHMMGFFSVFNADALKNVTLYKGSFPARFGSRLSSVVDIRMKDGDDKAYHGNVSVGLISSKFNVEGPIIKEKTTFNISARRTYADILMQPIIKIYQDKAGMKSKNTAGYYFYDLNAKITHKIDDKNKLFLSAYGGDDVIYLSTKDSYDYQSVKNTETVKMDWNWGNIVTALRWNHILSSKLFMNTTASFTRYRFKLGVGRMEEQVESNRKSVTDMSIGYNSGIEDYSARLDFDYNPHPKHDVKFGTNYIYHTFRPGVMVSQSKITESAATLKNDTTIGDKNVYAHENSLYIEDNINIIDALKLNAGLHYSLFNVQGETYHSLEPRLGIRFLVSDKLSFKAGFAMMSQYIHLLSNNNISLPTDLWVPVTKQIVPMKSKQYSAGAFYTIENLAEFSLEGYYKTMDNLIEYKDGASFMGSSTGWEQKVSMGHGVAYGVELLAQRSIGKTTGWVGYTWAKSDRIFDREGQMLNNGVVFPAKFDRRHDFKVTANHVFNEKIDISGTWVFSTGNTATLAMQHFYGEQVPFSYPTYNSNVPYISARNNFRYDSYHRMDVGINFHKKKKHGIRTWNISVYNVYNQNNPFFVLMRGESNYSNNYDNNNPTYVNKKRLVQYSIFPILPSVSYTYKF